MKIMNKIIATFAIIAVCCLVLIGCPPEDKGTYGKGLLGKWKTNISINVNFEDVLDEIAPIILDYFQMELDIETIKETLTEEIDIKEILAELLSESTGGEIDLDSINFSDFLKLFAPECDCDDCEEECIPECDCTEGFGLAEIFEILEIADWESLQDYIDEIRENLLDTTLTINVGVTIILTEDKTDSDCYLISATLDSASIGLTCGIADNAFALLGNFIELLNEEFADDPVFQMINFNISGKTISLKSKQEISEMQIPAITDYENLELFGITLSSNERTLTIDIATLLEILAEEFDMDEIAEIPITTFMSDTIIFNKQKN